VPSSDFDFLQEPWLIDNVLYRDGESSFLGEHSGIVKHMGGIVNTDVCVFTPPAPRERFRGMSLRLLQPATDEWSIYWINDTSVELSTPVRGRFDGNEGAFFSTTRSRGSTVMWRFQWLRTDTPTPHWNQAYSEDDGKSWTVDWTMDFRRP
jgi:hypothetical protein